MKANVNARPISFILIALLAVLLLVATNQAFALEKVDARATAEKESYLANTWVPLKVEINNESAYDIAIEEAGFSSIPSGLEKRGNLSTKFESGAKTVKAGSSAYIALHSMDVRKVTTSAQTTPTSTGTASTAKTSDINNPLAALVVALMAGVLAVVAARKSKNGMLSVLLVGVLAAGFVPALPVQQASAAASRDTAQCSVKVSIDGTSYEFPGYVIYTYETSMPIPGPDPDTVGFAITKVWNDASDQDNIRPASIKVNILADGKVYKTVDMTADDADSNDADKWVMSDYTNPGNGLPRYNDDDGKEIVYTVEEVADSVITGTDGVGTYAMKVEGSIADGFTITNTHTPAATPEPDPETVGFTITKVWDDADDKDGIRPEGVKVKILADGEEYQTIDITKSDADDSGNWVVSDYTNPGNGLPKYNEAGNEIAYTVEEVADSVVTGTDGTGTYAMKVEGSMADGFTITNTHTPATTPEPEPEKITIKLTKTWRNNELPDPNTPLWKPSDDDTANLVQALKLLADGTEVQGVTPVLDELPDSEQVTPTSEPGQEPEPPYIICTQTVTWSGLPKTKDGKEIVYKVEEKVMSGYNNGSAGVVTGNANDGFAVTNVANEETPGDIIDNS